MDKYIQFLKLFLESLDCQVDDHGAVLFRNPKTNEDEPLMVHLSGEQVSKPLYLPTPDVLRSGELDKRVMFHPACEGVASGNSEVLNRVVDLVSLRLYKQYALLMVTIAGIAANTDIHSKLSMRQKALIEKLPKVSGTLNTYLNDVLSKCTGVKGKHPLLTIRLKRGQALKDGAKFARVATLVPKILSEEAPLYDVKGADVNKVATQNLLREILFDDELVGASNANIAPSFMAIAELYSGAITKTNKLVNMLGKHAGVLRPIPESWYNDLDVLLEYKKYLPQVFPGNVGVNVAEKPHVIATATTTMDAINRVGLSSPAVASSAKSAINHVNVDTHSPAVHGRGLPQAPAYQAPIPQVAAYAPQRPMSRTEYMMNGAHASPMRDHRSPREQYESSGADTRFAPMAHSSAIARPSYAAPRQTLDAFDPRNYR